MTTAKQASTEISTETSAAAQGSDKSALPSLPRDFSEESLKSMFKDAEKEARATVPDVTTEQGRKDIKDMAKKVAASNKALDTPMRDYLRVIKAQPKVLEKNARESKARFDGLKADILKPLLDAQSSQDEIIAWLNGVPGMCSSPETLVTDLESTLETINGYSIDLVWPELRKKFKVAHESALTTTAVMLERAKESETQAKRLAELEKQAEEKRQKDRDREVAEQAAEKARQEEQAKAQRDREESNRRVAESAHREEQAAIREAQAKKDAIEAEKNRIAEIEKAKSREAEALKLAEENSRLAAKAAIEAEKERSIEAEKEQERLAKARAEDKELRIKVNRANLVVLIAAGFSEDEGKKFIKMVARGELPDIKIHY